MDNLLRIKSCVESIIPPDFATFLFLQFVIFITLVFSIYKDYTKGCGLVITRGNKSRIFFKNFAGIAVSLFLIAVFQISEYPSDGKLFYFLVDVSVVSYLSFYNSYFTNKLIGFLAAFEKRKW